MKPKYPQRLLDEMEKEHHSKPATTYCMEMIDGVRCHSNIPIGETLCIGCKQRERENKNANLTSEPR